MPPLSPRHGYMLVAFVLVLFGLAVFQMERPIMVVHADGSCLVTTINPKNGAPIHESCDTLTWVERATAKTVVDEKQ